MDKEQLSKSNPEEKIIRKNLDNGMMLEIEYGGGDPLEQVVQQLFQRFLEIDVFQPQSHAEMFQQVLAEGIYPIEQNQIDLYDATKRLVSYIQAEKIEDVAFIDRSARPGYRAMLEYWKLATPKYKRPNIYFFNPLGFETEETLDVYDHALREYHGDTITYKLQHTGQPLLDFASIRTESEMKQELEKTYKRLATRKEKPLLLVDTCIHGGETAGLMMDRFEAFGFTDVRLAVASADQNYAGFEPDVVLLDRVPEQPCLTFYPEYGYHKSLGSLHSTQSQDQIEVQSSSDVRYLVRDGIREQYKKEHGGIRNKLRTIFSRNEKS